MTLTSLRYAQGFEPVPSEPAPTSDERGPTHSLRYRPESLCTVCHRCPKHTRLRLSPGRELGYQTCWSYSVGSGPIRSVTSGLLWCDLGTDTGGGKDFEQHRMRLTAVNDVGLGHSSFDR